MTTRDLSPRLLSAHAGIGLRAPHVAEAAPVVGRVRAPHGRAVPQVRTAGRVDGHSRDCVRGRVREAGQVTVDRHDWIIDRVGVDPSLHDLVAGDDGWQAVREPIEALKNQDPEGPPKAESRAAE